MIVEYNLCPKCGGVVSLEQPHVTMRVYTSTFKMCTCPKPSVTVTMEPQHDGRLDKDYKVGYGSEWHIKGVRIQASDPSVAGNEIFLVPHRALSLLAWLVQEKPELERLVKEQGF